MCAVAFVLKEKNYSPHRSHSVCKLRGRFRHLSHDQIHCTFMVISTTKEFTPSSGWNKNCELKIDSKQ